MFFNDSCFHAPTAVLWLIGAFVAISRWKLHPPVSGAVLISLGCMLSVVVGQGVGIPLLFSRYQPASPQRLMLVLGFIGFVSSLVRAAGWATMLVAIFGWRDEPIGPKQRFPLQFSIRNLFILTLIIALLCGFVRGLMDLFGERAVFFFVLLDEIPTSLCWLYGGGLAYSGRRRHPEIARRVAIAIRLSAGGLVMLAAAFLWVIAATRPGEWFLITYALVGLVAYPISWALLLTAAFGWRTVDEPFRPPPEAFAALP